MRAFKLWLPVLLWAGLILSAANDDFSAGNTGGWLKRLFGDDVPYALHVAFRKATHVVVYAILGALVWRADKRWPVILGVALMEASADEWMQSRALNRTGTPWDVVLDLVGASLAVWLLAWRAKAKDEHRAR